MGSDFGYIDYRASQTGYYYGDERKWAFPEIKMVIEDLLIDEHYKQLHVRFKEEHSESCSDGEIVYLFHYACQCVRWDEVALDFIEAVIQKCLHLEKKHEGREVLKYLFTLQTSDGRVPFLAMEDPRDRHLENFVSDVRPDSNSSYSLLLDACDSRKWRLMHISITHFRAPKSLKEVVMGKMIDVNARLPSSKATALHLAIYHDRPEAVKIILEADLVDVNAILERNIEYGSKRKNGMKRSSRYWSPLQLAAIMGRADVVRILLTKVCYISTTICGVFFITRMFSLFTKT
jgi:hypothetical protein